MGLFYNASQFFMSSFLVPLVWRNIKSAVPHKYFEFSRQLWWRDIFMNCSLLSEKNEPSFLTCVLMSLIIQFCMLDVHLHLDIQLQYDVQFQHYIHLQHNFWPSLSSTFLHSWHLVQLQHNIQFQSHIHLQHYIHLQDNFRLSLLRTFWHRI